MWYCLYKFILTIFLSLYQLLSKSKALYAEISAVLKMINSRSSSSTHGFSDESELHSHVLELNDMLAEEQNCYEVSSCCLRI